MTILQALSLGLFQGIAEFLPISSSGHLLLLRQLLGMAKVPVLFDVILHLASLLSILVVFRKRILGIIVSLAKWLARKQDESDKANLSVIAPLLTATIITAIFGFSLRELDFSGQGKIISGFMVLTGLVLVASSRLKEGSLTCRDLGFKRSALIGLAQGFAVLPGLSRSGITISASLASGLNREEAGEFSFLLAIPAILGAFVLEAGDMPELLGSVGIGQLALGFAAAFAAGVLALRLLMPLVKKGKLAWFAAYLIPAGIAGLLFL